MKRYGLLRVVAAGLSLPQDSGRPDWEHLGVPASGSFDARAHLLACELVGLPAGPVVEVLAGDLIVEAAGPAPTVLAVCGEARTSRGPAQGSALLLPPGHRLTISGAPGAPSYLAAVGLDFPRTLGSTSHDTLSGLGPAPLSPGDTLATLLPATSPVGRFLLPGAVAPAPASLPLVPGPHWPAGFDERAFTVAAVSRTGVRLAPLDGEPGPQDVVEASFPVLPGCVQLPPSGEAIILGPDAGVTGGYPVAGCLPAWALPYLARLHPGCNISFRPARTGGHPESPLRPCVADASRF